MTAPRLKGGIGADGPFWDALDAGKFQLSRCGECREWLWPAHFRCGSCGSWRIVWENVAPKGKLYAWTRNHLVSDVLKERRGDLPYVTILVELPQAGGARVAGVLKGDETGLRIGSDVSGIILPAAENSRGFATMGWTLDNAPPAEQRIA